MKNRIDVIPGASGKTVVCIAGWATGPALFDRLFPNDRRVVITPFEPVTVVQDLRCWVQEDGASIDRVLGASMGVPLAIQFAETATPRVPVIGIGANAGLAPAAMDGIAAMVRRLPNAYLRPFWRSCAGVLDDESWMMNAFLDVGWTVESLTAGLDFLKWPWGETLLTGGVTHTFIHGADDVISPMGIMSKFAQTYGVELHIIDGVGHLPVGPYSVDRWRGKCQ